MKTPAPLLFAAAIAVVASVVVFTQYEPSTAPQWEDNAGLWAVAFVWAIICGAAIWYRAQPPRNGR